MIEADTRTHLHPVEEYGKLADTAQSIAGIRREVTTALVHGSALWWCDFGADGSGGWYDQPELIGEIAAMVSRQRSGAAAGAEVAWSDPQSCYHR
jgi:hypothetical protein